MKLLKRIIAVITLSVCFTVLVGCGASIDYFYSSDGSTVYYRYVVTMSSELRNQLLDSAATIPNTNKKWTLSNYFNALGSGFGWTVRTPDIDNGYCYEFSGSREISNDSADDEEEEDETDYELEKGFFKTRVIYAQGSPFNGVFEQFTGEEEAAQGSIIDVIKNGYGDLPAFTEAFPAAKEMDMTKITVRFLWDNDRLTPENGEKEVIDGREYSVWTASFDGEDRQIVYSYYVTNPVGWYVVILGVGLLVAGIIILVTLKSKKEPKFVEAQNGPVRYKNAKAGSNVYYSSLNVERKKVADDARRELDELFGTADDAKRDLDDIFGLNEEPEGNKNTDFIRDDGEDDEDKK